MKKLNQIRSLILGSALASAGILGGTFVKEANATCVPEPYIGSICITAGTYCPRDYIEANGGVLPISSYSTLYAVIGTSFGGNGVTTMGIPDLRGRSAIHYGTGPGLNTAYFGFGRGLESVTLDLDYLPTHNHSAIFTPSGGGGAVDVTVEAATNPASTVQVPSAGDYIGDVNTGLSKNNAFVPAGSVTSTVPLGGVTVTGVGSGGGTVTVGNTGASDPVPTIPPQLTMRFCMAIDGLFPPRT